MFKFTLKIPPSKIYKKQMKTQTFWENLEPMSESFYLKLYKGFLFFTSLTFFCKWTGFEQDIVRIIYRIHYEILKFNKNETGYHRMLELKKKCYIFF